ncbi:hypothetical protein MJ588_05440 [Klebsiella pneumoniae]|nr:hypothetical protein MJ588_05440 [Klebsiella pneumoniae]
MLDHRDLARQAGAAQQASRAFYHRWFPTEKKVINPTISEDAAAPANPHPSGAACPPRRPPKRLAKHPQRNAEDPSCERHLSWGTASNRLRLDIAAVSSRALEQFTQRARPRFRVRPGDMISQSDGIEGQLALEENDG